MFAVSGLMAGCAAPPPAPPPTPPVLPPREPPPAEPERPPAPPTPAEQQQAQKVALATMELLEAGNEEQARTDLQRALSLDPANKLAHNLLRQLTVDPATALGKESFQYVVKPGETLSRIAQRYMGDIYSFYLLARYNDIKVPRQLAGGQVIRIPGKAPPPEPRRPDVASPKPAVAEPTGAPALVPTPVVATPPPPAPPEPPPAERALRLAEAAERAGDLDRALAEYRRAGEQPGAAAKAEQVRKQLVARHTVSARTAFAKQDLDGTIGQWDRVLELDPGNETAKLERRKALVLQEKLRSVK
ncbi:MAG TPA: LysM domain-containing protein [Burkholderiaceae bacterium]|nr:LysM domain-containing protein [Burkholderiaceae bacterium]